MSKVSKMSNTIVPCIQWPLTPVRREGYLLQYLNYSLLLQSCGFWFTTSQSEEAVLLPFLDLSTTRVIADKMHSQSPILKTKGALSNLVILTYLQTKLHPPYPSQTACLMYEFRSEKCLQCLKTMGLYNSFGVGRFSFWQSWLTQASKFANSQASALNAGVSTDPYSPESNCSYLTLI